jgi:hypothetical protein
MKLVREAGSHLVRSGRHNAGVYVQPLQNPPRTVGSLQALLYLFWIGD